MNTLILEMNHGKPSTGQSRKKSPIEMGDFAQVLSFQETQSPIRPTLSFQTDEGGSKVNSEESGLSTRAEKTKEPSAPDPNKSSASSQETDTSRPRDGRGAEETEEGLSRASESGQNRQAESEKGVDGCENGVQPGSSTEATVNAQSQAVKKAVSLPPEQTGTATEKSEAEAEAAAAAPLQSQDLQQLVQQLAAAANTEAGTTGKGKEGTVSVKTIEKKTSVMPVNFNLTDQQIIFETGLAESFVRALTDQFEQVKGQNRQKSDAASDSSLTAVSANGDSATSAKALTSSVVETPQLSLTGDNAAESMNRIMQVIRSNIGRRQSQITVQLDPPELGKLRMDVKLVDNNLSLAITTETNEARQILSNRMETLRTSLEQSGITISKFEISTRSSDASQNQNWQQDQQSGHHGQSFAQHQQQGSNSFQQTSSSDTYFESDNETETNSVTVPAFQSAEKALNMVA